MQSNAHWRKKKMCIKAMMDSKLAITIWGRMLESFRTVLGKHWLTAQQQANWMTAIIRKGGEQR